MKPAHLPHLLLRQPSLGLFLIVLPALHCHALEETEARPPTTSPAIAHTQLVEAAREMTKEAGLKIQAITLPPSIEHPGSFFHRSCIQIEVEGDPKTIRAWVENLQALDKFRTIAHLIITPHREDPAHRRCKVTIHQWSVSEKATGKPAEINASWKTIAKKFSNQLSPGGVWEEVQKCVPENSGSLLAYLEITRQLETVEHTPNQIRIYGKGKPLASVNRFTKNLNESKSLDNYQWKTPPPLQTKSGKWSFVFTASSKKPSQ